MTPELAIVVPAYKPDFFNEALKSIRDQTDRRFSLYIFDDASHANLEDIVNQFTFDFQVYYKRFRENLGQQSIVKQWERCIAETGSEEWIWLFSDDDVMAPDCVESFYQTLQNKQDYAAYRFNTKKISENGNVIRENRFPDVFNGADFLNIKLSYQQESYIVEYIFSRKAYQQTGGFRDFPLAWASDDLFCLQLANYGNICTIEGGNVQWRYSRSNISGKNHRSSARLKMKASAEFVEWILNRDEIVSNLRPKELPVAWYVRQIRTITDQLSFWDELKAVIRMAGKDRRVWNYYLKMKWSKSKIAGWLKRFSL